MHAYGILSGGGVKGIALAGCVDAAQQRDVVFAGYGGTSAGSIISLLAAAGYGHHRRELMKLAIDEIDYSKFFIDGGKLLEETKEWIAVLQRSHPWWDTLPLVQKIRALVWLGQKFRGGSLGLYSLNPLREFLREKIRHKFDGHFSSRGRIEFEELERLGCAPVRVVATDLYQRRGVVFGHGSKRGIDALDAVCASAAFPLVFKPLQDGAAHLVDGGLSTNLPIFLFAEEQRRTRYPVLAFDIQPNDRGQTDEYGVNSMVRDMFGAALEASDVLLRDTLEKTIRGVTYIPVVTPKQIDTLDFQLKRADREALYHAGFAAATTFLNSFPLLNIAREAGDQLKRQLQAIYGPHAFYFPLLEALAREVETKTQAADIRCHVMLKSGRSNGSKIVVYHNERMARDTDSDLELPWDAGCSGAALTSLEGVAVADLQKSRMNPAAWRMTEEQTSKVPPDRKSMLSVVIPGWNNFDDLRKGLVLESPDARIGVLSVDSSTPLFDTGWASSDGKRIGEIAAIVRDWAVIFARLLP